MRRPHTVPAHPLSRRQPLLPGLRRRDLHAGPHKQVVEEQLNGGEIVSLTDEDWRTHPALPRGKRAALRHPVKPTCSPWMGACRGPTQVYRKVQAVKLAVLTQVEDAWE